jgi:hypothetical protein
MRLAKVVWFDVWVGVPGDAVALRPGDAILMAFVDGLVVEGEGRC